MAAHAEQGWAIPSVLGWNWSTIGLFGALVPGCQTLSTTEEMTTGLGPTSRLRNIIIIHLDGMSSLKTLLLPFEILIVILILRIDGYDS